MLVKVYQHPYYKIIKYIIIKVMFIYFYLLFKKVEQNKELFKQLFKKVVQNKQLFKKVVQNKQLFKKVVQN